MNKIRCSILKEPDLWMNAVYCEKKKSPYLPTHRWNGGSGVGTEHIFKGGLTQANIVDHFYLTHQFSVHGEVYSIQHYVIKFVGDLEQVDGFLWVLWFLPPIKLTAMI
jgi:hypothetical protein